MMMDFEAWYVTWEGWWGWRWFGFSDMKKLELLFGVLFIYLFGICLMGLWNGMLWKKFIFSILKFVFLFLGLLCWRCIWGFFFIGGFSLLKVWALQICFDYPLLGLKPYEKWDFKNLFLGIFYEVLVFELDHRNFIQWNWVLDFEADKIGGPSMFVLCLVVKE